MEDVFIDGIKVPTTDELLPCPFCGGEALCHQIGKARTNEKMWRVVCMKCIAGTTMGFDARHAKLLWNKRHQPLEPMYYPSEQMTSINAVLKRHTDLAGKYGRALQALKEVGENYENIDSGWISKLVKELTENEQNHKSERTA